MTDTPSAPSQGALLAADFGSVNTRVTLWDVVDGEYRLVSRVITPTTVGYPVDDVSVGLRRALAEITTATGRRFFDKEGQLITPEGTDRSGVDLFVTTASAGRPLRAAIIGLMPDISLDSAFRAINGVYVEAVATLHLEDAMTEEERLNALVLTRPDMIFIAGGTDGGAQDALKDMITTVRLALALTDEAHRPVVLYAGNRALVPYIQQTLGESTSLFLADNIRPSLDEEHFEPVTAELGRTFDIYKEKHGEGFSEVGRMSNSGVLPTAQSYALIAEYFAQSRSGDVIAIDMGSSTTTLVGVFEQDVDATVSTTLGLGHSASLLVEQLGLERLSTWLPFYPRPGEIRNYALNKGLRPASLPMTVRDLYIEHAFIRAAIHYLIENARVGWQGVSRMGPLPDVNLILAGGAALTNNGLPSYNLMLIVDSIRPSGITEVLADPYGLIPAMGAAARLNPEAVVQLIERQQLERLGTVISVAGIPQRDKTAMRIKLTTDDGEVITRELPGGHLVLLPLPANAEVTLEMRLFGGLRVQGKSRLKRKLRGGTAGLLLDMRGRPLRTAETVEGRADLLPMWVHEATDDPQSDIPESWLVPIEVAEEDALELEEGELATATASKPAPRRGLFSFFRRRPAAEEDVVEDEDDFMRLLDDEPVSSGVGIKGQTGPLDPRKGRKPGQTGPLDPRKVRKPGQTGPLDPKAVKPKDDDDLRGLL
jgi:uncharacterized protein (TIGR01319 family)